jgi:hypothetical protein
VIHAFGILYPVESSLKLRSNVQLTFLQAYVRRNREQSRKVLAQGRPSCWNYRSWHLEQAAPTMRLTVVKCRALKRMGEQGKFNLPA